MSKTANLMVRIDPAVKADIVALAAKDDRSLAKYVERVLRQHAGEMQRAGRGSKAKK